MGTNKQIKSFILDANIIGPKSKENNKTLHEIENYDKSL